MYAFDRKHAVTALVNDTVLSVGYLNTNGNSCLGGFLGLGIFGYMSPFFLNIKNRLRMSIGTYLPLYVHSKYDGNFSLDHINFDLLINFRFMTSCSRRPDSIWWGKNRELLKSVVLSLGPTVFYANVFGDLYYLNGFSVACVRKYDNCCKNEKGVIKNVMSDISVGIFLYYYWDPYNSFYIGIFVNNGAYGLFGKSGRKNKRC